MRLFLFCPLPSKLELFATKQLKNLPQKTAVHAFAACVRHGFILIGVIGQLMWITVFVATVFVYFSARYIQHELCLSLLCFTASSPTRFATPEALCQDLLPGR